MNSNTDSSVVWNLEGYQKDWREQYEITKQDLKEQMIKYGKTLKNLAAGEVLVIKANLEKCFGCDTPEQLTLTVRGQVLKDHLANRLSLDDAISQIKENERFIE